ncbi:MAG: uroporphyrinogen decarboxylase family protein [Planctomycetota bacterium]
MTNVERLRRALRGAPIDRLPRIEWAPWWNQTLDRWRGEGLPAELDTHEAIQAHFGLDVIHQLWVRPRAATCPKAPSHGAPIIASAGVYDRLVREGHLYPRPAFDAEALTDWAETVAAGEVVFWLTLEGYFWYPRTLLGIEPHLYAFYDDPALMRRMNADLLAHSLEVLDAVCEMATPTFMTIAEDMSYNHGPMLSKELFDSFLAPYYRKLVPALRERGIPVLVDSDGDVTELIPWLTGVGVEGLLPLERMAGVDVGAIRRDHREFIMVGAYDKTVMHRGADAMRAEFERLLPTMRTGRFIPSVDHQTPPGVSLTQYHTYLELLDAYCRKAVR